MAPAGWHPDPFHRFELRYWDGAQWTHHVASAGRQGIDPPVSVPPPPTVTEGSRKVQRQVRRSGAADGAHVGGGSVFTEPVLVVNQKPKLFEVNADYTVYDRHGRQVGAVREVGRGLARKAMGVRSDRTRRYRFQVVDVHGRVLISLVRPAKLARSKVIVRDAAGAEIGQIVQKNFGIIGNVRFDLEVGGRSVGSINAESRTAWDFSIQDSVGTEVARVTKTWAGVAKELFTKADNYVVEVPRPLDEPLRSLAVAAALAIDTALKQDGDWGHRRSR